MTRLAAPGASRNDHIHGDEHMPRELTDAERIEVEARAAQIVGERLSDPYRLLELIEALDMDAYGALEKAAREMWLEECLELSEQEIE